VDTQQTTWQIVDGILAGAEQVASPNCNARPPGCDVQLIVIHNISLPPGSFGGPHIAELFTNCLDPAEHPYFAEISNLEVSAHFLIRRDGVVQQFVSTDERAWHAGESVWRGQSNCNDFSVGIELEGADHEPYADAQYTQLAKLVCLLRKTYSKIEPDAIVGHSDIAPGRKTDPGPSFDWARLNREASRNGD
jgi:AmpD protein